MSVSFWGFFSGNWFCTASQPVDPGKKGRRPRSPRSVRRRWLTEPVPSLWSHRDLPRDPSQAVAAPPRIGPACGASAAKIGRLGVGLAGHPCARGVAGGGFANSEHAADAAVICTNPCGLGTGPTTPPSETVVFGVCPFGDAREDAVAGLGAAAEVSEESLCPSPCVPGFRCHHAGGGAVAAAGGPARGFARFLQPAANGPTFLRHFQQDSVIFGWHVLSELQ